jgi:hypothetical protein
VSECGPSVGWLEDFHRGKQLHGILKQLLHETNVIDGFAELLTGELRGALSSSARLSREKLVNLVNELQFELQTFVQADCPQLDCSRRSISRLEIDRLLALERDTKRLDDEAS